MSAQLQQRRPSEQPEPNRHGGTATAATTTGSVTNELREKVKELNKDSQTAAALRKAARPAGPDSGNGSPLPS